MSERSDSWYARALHDYQTTYYHYCYSYYY